MQLLKASIINRNNRKKDNEKYSTFWKEFGQVLKEGLAEDFANREKIAKLLRFSSTEHGTAEQRDKCVKDSEEQGK